MPTILRVGPYRFFFYAGDRNEPLHVHVERDQSVAKFWLEPVRFHSSEGFSGNELNRIQKIVIEYREQLIKRWHEYFNP